MSQRRLPKKPACACRRCREHFEQQRALWQSDPNAPPLERGVSGQLRVGFSLTPVSDREAERLITSGEAV